MMFQVDILHCLAISILMLMVFIVIARTPRRFVSLTAGSAAVIILASPLVWLNDLSDVVTPYLAPYFNQNVPSFSRSFRLQHISSRARCWVLPISSNGTEHGAGAAAEHVQGRTCGERRGVDA